MQNIFFCVSSAPGLPGFGSWAEPLILCVCFSFYLIKTLNAHKKEAACLPWREIPERKDHFLCLGLLERRNSLMVLEVVKVLWEPNNESYSGQICKPLSFPLCWWVRDHISICSKSFYFSWLYCLFSFTPWKIYLQGFFWYMLLFVLSDYCSPTARSKLILTVSWIEQLSVKDKICVVQLIFSAVWLEGRLPAKQYIVCDWNSRHDSVKW